jgi:uncharacterized membrane protein YkoI
MRKTGAFFVGLVLAGFFAGAATADTGRFTLGHKYNQFQPEYDGGYELAQYAGEEDGYGGEAYPISPSQAASIAKDSWPGAKVIRVQLLKSGVYAVTLKQGGEVSRVMVDATTGDLG